VDLVATDDAVVIVGTNQGGRTGAEQFSIVGSHASTPAAIPSPAESTSGDSRF
jgi:hypothetical protein